MTDCRLIIPKCLTKNVKKKIKPVVVKNFFFNEFFFKNELLYFTVYLD